MNRVRRGLLVGAGFFSRNHLQAWAEVEGGEIEGRLGTVEILEGQVLRIHAAGGRRDEAIPADGRAWTSAPWTQIQDSVPRTQQHFIDALRDGMEFETSARDSLKTYALAEAADRSAASGRAISPADLLQDA